MSYFTNNDRQYVLKKFTVGSGHHYRKILNYVQRNKLACQVRK